MKEVNIHTPDNYTVLGYTKEDKERADQRECTVKSLQKEKIKKFAKFIVNNSKSF